MRRAALVAAFLVLTAAVPESAVPKSARPPPLPTGELIEEVRCEVDPSQTYTLYLPSGHTPERRWPALLIFDPRGRSVLAAELFREAAERYGWVILSSNDTRSDGSMDPNDKAIAALWPEVHTRYSIDFERIYAAGFSGGAMLAWALGRATGELAGVISSGGRLETWAFDEEKRFPCFGAAGNTDFNYTPMREVHALLERWGTANRLEVFDGRHGWMPSELAAQGVEWLELQAMKQNLRPRDGELIEALWVKDLAKARALEAVGRALEAVRRYRAIAATFEGLREVDGARREAARLEVRLEVEEARRQEKRWDGFEATYLARLPQALALLRQEPPVSVRRLSAELRLKELEKRAEAGGYEGVVARRLLETLWTQTSFYLTRDLFARGDYRSAATVLTIAAEIAPERPRVWYNLACALARSGSRQRALEALERAVDAGYADAAHLASDPDLESLRRDEGFQRLVARLGG